MQLVHWIRTHAVLGGVVEALDSKVPSVHTVVQEAVARAKAGVKPQEIDVKYKAGTNEEHTAICWHVVSGVADLAGIDGRHQSGAMLAFASFLRMGEYIHKPDEAIGVIRDVALDGVFEFLDEQLDRRNAIVGLLLKYKQRCEWFWRERLRDFANSGLEGVKGERALARDLYDYILEQGVDFTIEPHSAGGEVDLLLKEPEGRFLIIDAKYITKAAQPSKLKNTLAAGFHQVHRYCRDFSEPSGFLVVFLETAKKLVLPLAYQDGFPAINIAGTVVYCLTISIADEPTASKAGKAEEMVIEEEDLKLTDDSDL
jgi:hypothetical protein